MTNGSNLRIWEVTEETERLVQRVGFCIHTSNCPSWCEYYLSTTNKGFPIKKLTM